MKKLLIASVISLFSLHANAGLWDSITGLFGSDEKEVTEEVADQAATMEKQAASVEKSATSDMVAQGMALLPMLTKTLGVTETQATGGMGALLQAATSLLSDGDSKSLLSAIPGASTLMSAAPALKKLAGGEAEGGMLAGAMGAAAEYSDKAKAASQLTSQFESLGLGADMIPKFADTASSFLDQSGKGEVGKLLSSTLGGLF